MRTSKWLSPAILGLMVLGGCNADVFEPRTARTFNQVQRLGNPLVSEVFLAKRSHPQHGTTGPADDVAGISDEFKSFVTGVAGRSQTLANTLASVLLPDMLIVQTDK